MKRCLGAGLLLAMGFAMTAAAQEAEVEIEHEVAASEAEMQREMDEAKRELEEAARIIAEATRLAEMEGRNVDVEVEMREAESRLAEAAQRIAELSTQRLPMVMSSTWSTESMGRPVLGITIGAQDEGKPVEGVEIMGVTPGGAADEAGLRTGDVLVSVNGDGLSADSPEAANRKLLDFMAGVEEGDALDIEYLRAGKNGKVTVEPRSMSRSFAFAGGGPNFSFNMPPNGPGGPGPHVNRFVFFSNAGGLGDMEMVRMSEGLGRYFGTDKGMLVVRAPEESDTYKLQDGDVILDIDGREPTSVPHAVRILGSYQAGETLKLRIMRDKRSRTVEIEIPDNRTGSLLLPPAGLEQPLGGSAPAD